MPEFPQIIKDGDIELRRREASFEDARRVFELIENNRTHLEKWETWVKDIKQSQDLLGMFRAAEADPEDIQQINYLVFMGGELTGSCALMEINKLTRSAKIAYWLGAEFTGRGIATRAAKTLEDLAFGTMDFNRLAIIMDDENKKSVAVAQRLGYKLDGIMRDDVLRSDGTIGNSCVYSKLKREWQSEDKK